MLGTEILFFKCLAAKVLMVIHTSFLSFVTICRLDHHVRMMKQLVSI